MTTRGDIENLARDNQIVHHCVSAYLSGRVSWEQAMMEAVVTLARVNAEQYQLLEDSIKKSITPALTFVKKD